MATAHVQHSSLISSSLKEHMFAEETDMGVGGGGEEGQEIVVEVPLHNISVLVEQRTPQSNSKRPDTQPK